MEHGFSGRSGRKFLEATELVMHEKIVLFFSSDDFGNCL